MSRAIRNSDQTTFDKVIRKMDKIADDIQLLSIVTTIFGAICFITSAYFGSDLGLNSFTFIISRYQIILPSKFFLFINNIIFKNYYSASLY